MAFNLTVTRDSIFINGETISPPPGKRRPLSIIESMLMGSSISTGKGSEL